MDDIKTIGSVIIDFYRSQNPSKARKALLKTAWREIMPRAIIDNTGFISLKNRCLIVQIDSPSVRHELQSMKSLIIKKLNDKVSSLGVFDKIDNLVFS